MIFNIWYIYYTINRKNRNSKKRLSFSEKKKRRIRKHINVEVYDVITLSILMTIHENHENFKDLVPCNYLYMKRK